MTFRGRACWFEFVGAKRVRKSCAVVMEIDEQRIANRLGMKAAASKGRKSQYMQGMVKLKMASEVMTEPTNVA